MEVTFRKKNITLVKTGAELLRKKSNLIKLMDLSTTTTLFVPIHHTIILKKYIYINKNIEEY